MRTLVAIFLGVFDRCGGQRSACTSGAETWAIVATRRNVRPDITCLIAVHHAVLSIHWAHPRMHPMGGEVCQAIYLQHARPGLNHTVAWVARITLLAGRTGCIRPAPCDWTEPRWHRAVLSALTADAEVVALAASLELLGEGDMILAADRLPSASTNRALSPVTVPACLKALHSHALPLRAPSLQLIATIARSGSRSRLRSGSSGRAAESSSGSGARSKASRLLLAAAFASSAALSPCFRALATSL